jgi:hypothetical protein
MINFNSLDQYSRRKEVNVNVLSIIWTQHQDFIKKKRLEIVWINYCLDPIRSTFQYVPCQSFVQLTKDIKDQEEDYVKSSSILCTHNFNARLILKWSQFKSPLSCDHFFHFNTQPLQFKGASIVAMNANKHIITSIEKSKRYRFPNTTNKPKPGNEFNFIHYICLKLR